MINNMIKLFYSEVVKTKINGMANQDYELRTGCKKIRTVTSKIDTYTFKILKILLCILILYFSFNINTFMGVGVLLMGIIYIFYKISYKNQVKQTIKNIKENIEISKDNYLNDDIKKGINLLMVLLIISLLSGFNYFVGISIFIVFIFTIKKIYEIFR